MTFLNKSLRIIKYYSMFGFTFGYSIGLWINMDIKTKYINGNRKTMYRIPPPIFMGFLGLLAPISISMIPLGIVNYFTNSSIIDKIYDEVIKNKYNISYERYHQYGSTNTKYDYPSHIIINIEKKINKINLISDIEKKNLLSDSTNLLSDNTN